MCEVEVAFVPCRYPNGTCQVLANDKLTIDQLKTLDHNRLLEIRGRFLKTSIGGFPDCALAATIISTIDSILK